MNRNAISFILLIFLCKFSFAQQDNTRPAGMVNVFLGTSGDHGQLSPAASSPFSMLSIGPQTYPKLHAGYEYEAKRFQGFTHNRFEGVGCQGSGGNILIKPFLDNDYKADLIKLSQSASPGYYQVSFSNKIQAEMTVDGNSGMHRYRFPEGKKGLYINLAHAHANKFVAEEHVFTKNSLSGWVEARTTCNVGTYRSYYFLAFDQDVKIKEISAHEFVLELSDKTSQAEVKVGMSAVDAVYAKASINTSGFNEMKSRSSENWNNLLSRFKLEGDLERKKLFYSLLYRTLQSPYRISEPDGIYRGTDGKVTNSSDTLYNGWAIWDNYRTQLPLLSVAYPDKYKGIVSSIANLYRSGKHDYAGMQEPTNTVRTEHAIVVLLDSYRKGYPVKFEPIIDSLIREVDHLDFSKPDKALESSYDTWALSEILGILKKEALSKIYRDKALEYRKYWNADFKDLTKKDVDKVQARNLYQGTIWQYRWFVPFDVKGLIELTGGNQSYIAQLDNFFDKDLYNHANEPDLQVPLMYNTTSQSYKSQELMHRFAVDTVIQYYFNDNSKGIDPFIDRAYKNEPKAYIRTMDDDAGAMSAWWILTACGISPACPGWPVYYLNVPLFSNVTIRYPGKAALNIKVENYSLSNKYINKVILNGKILQRNYITHQELAAGGKLIIVAADKPVNNPSLERWISEMK